MENKKVQCKSKNLHLKVLIVIIYLFNYNISDASAEGQINVLSLDNELTKFSNISKLFSIDTELLELSSECVRQLNHYKEGFIKQDMWALRMFDATSKLQSGILDGNIYNLGSYDECMSIHNQIVEQEDLINGKYCLGSIHFKAEEASMAWSICAPEKCSTNDLNQIMTSINMPLTFSETNCHSKSQDPEIDSGDIAVISCFVVILLIMIISSLYDFYLGYVQKEACHPVLLAFSVISNGRKLFSTSRPKNSDQLECLSGIRAISMMWIILGHTFSNLAAVAITNLFSVLDFYNDGWTMYIRGATVSVDTFFLMSGIVMIYVYMKSTKENQVWFNVPMYYLHRYLRLTPALAAVLVVHLTILKHFGSGPLWPNMNGYAFDNCQKYWWSVLLYIQNYVNPYELCIGQSWYLSVDTQLFFISPLFLIPIKRWPRITMAIVLVAACASVAAGFAMAWIYELKDINVLSQDANDSKNYMTKYYTATYTRAAPWLIGMIVGYIIYKVKLVKKNFEINKVLIVIMWICSLAVLITCLFYDNATANLNRAAMSSYIAFVRPAWAIALSWIIFACVTGYGGVINRFLSLPIFQILARLTYTMYITHFTILLVIDFSLKDPVKFSNAEQLYNFWSAYVLVFAISTIWTLAFESPIIIIEKTLLRGKSKVEKNSSAKDPRKFTNSTQSLHENSCTHQNRNSEFHYGDNNKYVESNKIQSGIVNRSYDPSNQNEQAFVTIPRVN